MGGKPPCLKKKGLHDASPFIWACNLYRRHIKNFTFTSAILTDLIKKATNWLWGPQEQQAFDELKDKVANAKCLDVPRAQGEIILVTDASNVGGGGTVFQWQALEKEEFDSTISQWGTDGLNRDGTLKHSYPDDKWVLVPLGHWNWKWNQAQGNYSTYEQELLAGMLVLSSQSRLLGSNPVVWLCNQEPVRVKFPLCISFLHLNSLCILWLHLLWCLLLLHFRYSKISMENKTRRRLQDEQNWDQ